MENSDVMSWNPTPSGQFSVRSAYEISLPNTNSLPKGLWNTIWKLHLPLRIRMFTWLIYHGKILTNLERYHRGYTIDSYCHFCPGEIEDLNHLFRFCAKADLFWKRLLGGRYQQGSQATTFRKWLEDNLKYKETHETIEPWKDCFPTCLWWIWRWRNEAIFNGKEIDLERKIYLVRNYTIEVHAAFSNNCIVAGSMQRCEITWVGWSIPQHGWCALSTDGCFQDRRKIAGAGGSAG